MKKLVFVVTTIVLTALVSCTKKVDPIHSIQPLNEAYSQRISMELYNSTRLKDDIKSQFNFIDRNRKKLTANIITQHPDITNHEQISLLLGSGQSDAIEAGDGKVYPVVFTNELLIIISDSMKSDTVFFGGQKPKSQIKFTKKADFGHGAPFRFTINNIEKVDSLISDLRSWGYTVNPKISIKDENDNVIEEQTFQKYLVTFKPFFKEGDVIDIIRGKIFDKDGQETTIEKRKFKPSTNSKRKRR